ncbi:MAG: DUF4038 domain-containing protein [Verrucomicrobiia bacterium]
MNCGDGCRGRRDSIGGCARAAGYVILAMLGWGLSMAPCLAQKTEFSVATSGRHLLLNDRPFFWLGDTVWLLAQMPDRGELEVYLAARAKQGFTVIQLTAVMAEERVWGTKRANAFGDKPFINDNPGRPAVTPGHDWNDPAQYDYWDHFDHVLRRIHAHGMRAAVVTMFVGWGSEGYKFLRPDNALDYGRFLGKRYGADPQIIWILGGDNTPDTPDKRSVWNLVAKGITEGATGTEDYARTLMTYHINGGKSSSEFWHDAPWLDFNMAQTWSEYKSIYAMVQRDYVKTPVKPCGLGEGAYEDGPQYPTKPIDALVIRKQAYWSYFAGGYHTYGNGNVWHFDSLKAELTQPWREALASAGALDMITLRKFMDEVEWWRFVPDQALLGGAVGESDANCAMRTQERDAFVFYLTRPGEIRLALGSLANSGRLAGTWINPATGDRQQVTDLSAEKPVVSMPPTWKDALLWIKR